VSLPTPTLPSTVGAFSIASTNFSVDLPSTMDSDVERRSFNNYIEDVPGLDGGVRTRGSARSTIDLSISGFLTSSSLAQDLRRTLGEGSVTITRGSRTLSCEVSDFSLKEVVTGKLWNFSGSFVSPSGYWSGGYTTTSADPSTVTNNGDLATFPRLIITGGAGGATEVTASTSGRTVTYTGGIADGETLVIDTFEGVATLDGVPVLANLNSSFFTNPLRLVPGSNTITYSVTGTASVVFYFEERYL